MRSRAFTLIEILISMALQLFLISMVLVFFSNFSRVFKQQIKLLGTQEEILLASYLLRQEITHAGYWGCQSLAPDQGIQIQSDQSFSIRHASLNTIELNTMPNQETLIVPSHPINPRHEWMIADCQQSERFEIQSFKDNGQQLIIRLTHPLKHHYIKRSLIAPVEVISFYLKKKPGRTQLMMKRRREPPQVLMDEVSDMKIHRKKGDPKYFYINLTVSHGSFVIAARQRN